MLKNNNKRRREKAKMEEETIDEKLNYYYLLDLSGSQATRADSVKDLQNKKRTV